MRLDHQESPAAREATCLLHDAAPPGAGDDAGCHDAQQPLGDRRWAGARALDRGPQGNDADECGHWLSTEGVQARNNVDRTSHQQPKVQGTQDEHDLKQ